MELNDTSKVQCLEFTNNESKAVRQRIIDLIDNKSHKKVGDIIEEVSNDLWEKPELGRQEKKAVKLLTKELKRNHFSIVKGKKTGVDIDTVFVAEYGQGKPVLGILLEYDALPNLGNAAVPYKQERKDGITNGHACGHNLIGAGGLGAALALKNVMKENRIKGTLRVYGAASEEDRGAKVYMADTDLFNDVDAMLHWHPLNKAMVLNVKTAALDQLHIEFTGKTAHAALAPWEGKSALHAAELFTHCVNQMREHILPTSRVHYIIDDGGKAPNIIPDYASVKLTFRGESREEVNKNVDWIQDMAEGISKATRTSPKVTKIFGMYDILPNKSFAKHMHKNLKFVGLPTYDEKENKFINDLITNIKPEEEIDLKKEGMVTEILPIPDNVKMGGSSDVGDLSWLIPTMGVVIPSIPQCVGVHTWMATACHGYTIGVKAAITAAKVLALTGYDLLTDDKLLKRIKDEFSKSTEGFQYKSPLHDNDSEDQKEKQFPKTLEDHLCSN